MDLGKNIYALRTEKRMSQGALADALKVSHQSISKWENGAAMPELEKLIKMSCLFEVTLDEMVNGKKDIPQHRPPIQRTNGFHRIAGGWLITLFGLIFLMLALIWHEPLSMNGTVGALAALGLLLIGWALVSDFSPVALGVGTLAYGLCTVMANRIFDTAPMDHLFLGCYGLMLFGWLLLVFGRMARRQKN